MKKACLLIFCLLFIQNIWAQQTREPLSEDEQKLSDELKNDREFIRINCERRGIAVNPDRDTSYRLKAIRAFTEAVEKSKLKNSCGTVEGDPIFSYLTVEKGKAKVLLIHRGMISDRSGFMLTNAASSILVYITMT